MLKEDKTIYVFNKHYLDIDPHDVLKELRVESPSQLPIEGMYVQHQLSTCPCQQKVIHRHPLSNPTLQTLPARRLLPPHRARLPRLHQSHTRNASPAASSRQNILGHPRPPRTGDHGRLRSHCVDGKQGPRQTGYTACRCRRRSRPDWPSGDSHRVYVIGCEKSDRERGAAAHAGRLCIEREDEAGG